MDWGERIVQMLYLGTLAVWIGAVVGVAAVAAPALFRKLPRPQAGETAAEVMLRLNVLRLAVVAVIVPVALARLVLWDRADLSGLVAARYITLFVMTQVAIAAVVVAMMTRLRAQKLAAGSAGADPQFRTGHSASRGLALVEIALGLAVLFMD